MVSHEKSKYRAEAAMHTEVPNFLSQLLTNIEKRFLHKEEEIICKRLDNFFIEVRIPRM